jgi:hypothetical protein
VECNFPSIAIHSGLQQEDDGELIGAATLDVFFFSIGKSETNIPIARWFISWKILKIPSMNG